jgi:peptide/nickel transport system permease protein
MIVDASQKRAALRPATAAGQEVWSTARALPMPAPLAPHVPYEREHGVAIPERPSKWRRLLATPTAVIGGVILLAYVLLAAFGSSVAPYPPLEFHYQDTLQAPTATYWFGTDQYGRDVFSRVLAGSRSIIVIAFGAMALGVAAGALIGLTAGYYGGKADEAIMRIADGMMSFPSLLLALLILTTLGPSIGNIVIGVAITFVPRVARIIRSVALDLRTQPFVDAARARGESTAYIVTRELLPNAVPAILVESSIRVGYAILIGASLGFLGLGVQPPTPDWGLMIFEGRSMIQVAPWLVLGPALAISILVIAANLCAEGMTRVLDSTERIEDAS